MGNTYSPIRTSFIPTPWIIAFSALMLVACSRPLRAQSAERPFLLAGVSADLNFVQYSTAQFAMLNEEPTCFQAQNGSGKSARIGANVHFPLSPSMQDFIVVNVVYNEMSASFTPVGNSAVDNIPTKLRGQVGPGSVSTSMLAGLAYFDLGVGLKHNLFDGTVPTGPSIELMPVIGVNISHTLRKMVDVGSITGSQEVKSNTDIDKLNKLRFSVVGQLAYDIPIAHGDDAWIVSPQFGYDLAVTKVDGSTRKWSASGAFAGVSVHRGFFH